MTVDCSKRHTLGIEASGGANHPDGTTVCTQHKTCLLFFADAFLIVFFGVGHHSAVLNSSRLHVQVGQVFLFVKLTFLPCLPSMTLIKMLCFF